ncbi:MAG: TetR family transcriptional regulator C-terminal domain-containing protein [Candidatus Nanopelagicales bacterium]
MPKVVDHEERRQAIVNGMWKIVQRDGFQAVSVRSVAAEVGLSKSTIAHYFGSQDQILALAVAQQIEATTEELNSLDVSKCTPAVALRAMQLAIPTTARQRRQSQVWLALLEQHGTSPEISQTLTDLNREVRSGVRTVLAALAANGFVAASRDLDEEAAKFHAVIDGLSLQSLTDPKTAPPALVEQVITAMIADLGRPAK